MRLSTVIEKVRALAEAIQAHRDAEPPTRCPTCPFIRASEGLGPPPPEKAQLRELLRSQSTGTVHALAVLMYLGRGDDEAEDDLLAAYGGISNTFLRPAWVIQQLVGNAALARHLRAGVEKLARSGWDVDECWVLQGGSSP
jgi:hypothetical protein